MSQGISVKYGTFAFSGIGNDPLVSFNTNIERSSAGYIVGVYDSIKLDGVIYAEGEINDSGNKSKNSGAWTNLIKSVTGLVGLSGAFVDYQELQLLCNNIPFYKSDPESTIVESINFSNNSDENWLKIIDYSIQLKARNTGYIDYIKDSGYYIADFQDTYSIQTNNNENYYIHIPTRSTTGESNYPYSISSQFFPIYSISRTISAKGLKTKTKSAIENAKSFISGLTNNTGIQINKIINSDSLILFDRSTSISIDSLGGSYTINDSFSATSGKIGDWNETFSIESTIDNNLLRTVNIKGVVRGVEAVTGLPDIYKDTNDSDYSVYAKRSTNKFANASGAFHTGIQPKIFSRILNTVYPSATVTGLSQTYPLNKGINPIPLNCSIDYNVINGEVSYSYSYDSRPLALVTGAISETLNFEESYAIRTYHFQDVYYRFPLSQDIGTFSVPSRTVTYEAFFPRPFLGASLPPNVLLQIDNLIDQFNPNKLNPINTTNTPRYFSWTTANEEDFDILQGKYTRKKTWKYQKGFFPNGFY